MKENYGIDVNACIYNEPYCRYWRACIEEKDIQYFASKKMQILYEHTIGKKKKLEESELAKSEFPNNKRLNDYM